jgi:hypothetical protein
MMVASSTSLTISYRHFVNNLTLGYVQVQLVKWFGRYDSTMDT